MPNEDNGLLRHRRWSGPMPAYGPAGLADQPLTPDHVERITALVMTARSVMVDLIGVAREVRADGHDGVGYQLETLSTDLEMAIEWELATGDVVTARQRIECILTNTWVG